MITAITQFRANIVYLRNIAHLYTSIKSITTSAVDLSDFLRAGIVMSVSTLDHYIHEITRLGIIESFEGIRVITPALRKFPVSLDGAIQGIQTVGNSAWIDSEIRARHSYLSFQQPEKIADAIKLISQIRLWESLSTSMSMPASDIMRQIKLIVDRRNKIAHEADLDPSFPGTRWPISIQNLTTTIDFVENLCENIHVLII